MILLDPSEGVARWTAQLLDQRGLRAPQDREGEIVFISTGDVHHLASMAERLIGETGSVISARWNGNDVLTVEDH